MTPKEREAFYDAEISPAILDLARQCQDNGLSFLALIEWCPDDSGLTRVITKDGSQFFRAVEAAARDARADGGAFNLDAFVFALARETTENLRPHSSIVLSRLGIDPDPEKRGPKGGSQG